MPQQQVHARVSQPGADAATRTAADDDVDQAVAEAQERGRSDIVEHSDELLDEIDAILIEEERFAVRYVQRGGE